MRVKRNERIPDAILTSDWHLMERSQNPPCRLDEYWSAVFNKVKQISDLQKKYDCPVFVAGDVFEHWRTSPELINKTLSSMPNKTAVIAGQHDLPQHSFKLVHKSGFDSLIRGKSAHFLHNQFSWGLYEKSKKKDLTVIKGRKIAVIHMLVWDKDEPYPGCTAPQVNQVFKMFPDADLILTGDNHQTFFARKGKQLLINPGSLTRHKADQIKHRPCVFLWYADTNSFLIHYLKIRQGVISREHRAEMDEKKRRTELFLSHLNNTISFELSFEDNLIHGMDSNRLPKGIKKHIIKWMEG